MNNYLIDYFTYMRHLAEQHTALRHTPEERHYFTGEIQDFFANLRSEVHFPALVAEGSDVEYTGNKANLGKKRTTSFSVVDSYSQNGDIADMVLKVSHCERIAEQILGRMLTDREKPFRTIDIESIQGEYNANEAQRYVGYRITLTLTDANVCINTPDAWLPEPEEEQTEENQHEED